MIPYDSQDFPSAYGIGPGNLTTSWDDLLWAGLTVGRPALETVYEPGRNTALFDHLRYWAYPQSKGDDLDAWRGRRDRAANERALPGPTPRSGGAQGLVVGRVVDVERRRPNGPFDPGTTAAWDQVGARAPQRYAQPGRGDRGGRPGGLYAPSPASTGLSDFAVRYIVARDAPLLRGGGAM